jgi:hypothetical protein
MNLFLRCATVIVVALILAAGFVAGKYVTDMGQIGVQIQFQKDQMDNTLETLRR